MNPLVTVILPVFNSESFLRTAIDSILNQTFIDFEFLIINDGSTDTSRDIILSYTDKRIRFLENEINIGLIKTLNKGIREAKGEYIARMDADDISRHDRFEKQVEFLDANPEYGIVGSWCTIIGSEKTIEYHSTHDSLEFALLHYCCFVHPSVMIRKLVLIDNQLFYNEDYLHSEDYELWTRLLTKTKGYNIKEYLLAYREHQGQVSFKYRQDQIDMINDIVKNYLSKKDPLINQSFCILFDGKKNIDTPTYLINLNDFYVYCIQNNIFEKSVLKQNVLSLYKKAFFEQKNLSLFDYRQISNSELYFSLKLSCKQRMRFFLRISAFS